MENLRNKLFVGWQKQTSSLRTLTARIALTDFSLPAPARIGKYAPGLKQTNGHAERSVT